MIVFLIYDNSKMEELSTDNRIKNLESIDWSEFLTLLISVEFKSPEAWNNM